MTTPRRSKPKKEHVNLLLDEDLLEKVDRKAEQLQAAQPGARVTRSDVLRMAVHQFVKET